MVRAKLISLSRLWYTILVLIIHIVLIYFGIKQCYFNDRLLWPKSFTSSSPQIELLIQKICLLTALILLFLFIFPALFRIGNYSNDQQQLTSKDLKKKHSKSSLCSSLWHHCFALSGTLHLTMSFLIIISTVLIDAKQIMVGLKDSGIDCSFERHLSLFRDFLKANVRSFRLHYSLLVLALLWRTDFDLLFDWSSIKHLPSSNQTSSSFSNESYTRLSLFNFLFASFICIIREPQVFWSISKLFSFIYSFALALSVLQWCLMYSAFQLLLKNICFNTIESTLNIGYLLLHQPYTTFFLYLLLEFLIYISSITFYYYAYNRFKFHENLSCKSSCYDRCSHYCPSLIAIIILLLYTSCKMPLVHDIFLLYIQTRLHILFATFIFEIVHVLLLLALWIYLTTKIDWHDCKEEEEEQRDSCSRSRGLTVQNTSIQPTAISLPELNGNCSSSSEKTARRLSDTLYQKPYEKIRIFQSEIYYRNQPKNWSLPANQQPTMMAAFDHDDEENDIVVRSTVLPVHSHVNNPNELQYREAIRKTVSNLYKPSPTLANEDQPSNTVLLRNNTPPTPPVKHFTQDQIEAARVRAQQIINQQVRPAADYMQHHRSATLLISQV